jgi:hypothetical protein
MNSTPPTNRSSNQLNKSEGAQFFLDIRYHQHNSWQGSVQRLDTGEVINFRSALELMTLMEEVIRLERSTGSEGSPLRKWKQERREWNPHKCNGTTDL